MTKLKEDYIIKNSGEQTASMFDKVIAFIKSLLDRRPEKKPLDTYNLGGRFDKDDIRAHAYE